MILVLELIAKNHDLQVRFKWNKNDVAIWDNRSVFHTGTKYVAIFWDFVMSLMFAVTMTGRGRGIGSCLSVKSRTLIPTLSLDERLYSGQLESLRDCLIDN